MRFAADVWLWGVLCSLLLGLIFMGQGFRLARARSTFGDNAQVGQLLTSKTGSRRAISAVLCCLAVAFAFLAAAQPQYGRGTRVLPATNLDVVLVLDFSKSMYARDVSPSRIGRAKVEVARLVRELGGARFGAVAFAGESISFPLTSDGAAIAQFFRGLEPNDMPLGGTAIARALETGRQLFERDPLSKSHERVLILITDGEDLEGDPVEVARSIREAGMRVEVVQIGGQSPEPIPNIDDEGIMHGLRRDAQGHIMTTALSPEGEAQLGQVASVGGGQIVRASVGQVGIDEMSSRLRRLMTEELSERVETVYADVFQYPLAAAVLLLMIEVWIGTAPRRVVLPEPPRGKVPRRRLKRRAASVVLVALLSLGCADFDRVFERKAPVVEDAILALNGGQPDEATKALIQYLETGPCEEGVIGVGDRARKYADAAYDLALAFSHASAAKPAAKDPSAQLAQGQIPGLSSATPTDPSVPPRDGKPASAAQIDCALRLLAPLGPSEALPVALRARSLYLAGNLELSRSQFEPAISYYDQAILLSPGVAPGQGDALGMSIAFNRALALRLQKEEEEKQKQEQKDSEQNKDESESKDENGENQDKPQDQESKQDQPQDQKQDPKQEEGKEEKESPENQPPPDQKDQQQPETNKDQKDQAGNPNDSAAPPDQDPRAAQPPPKSDEQSRDERMLDLLEQAPTLQQHEAQKAKAAGARGRATMEDK